MVLEAWPEVERRTGATLLLVGDGPARRHLKAHSESRRVVWLPLVSDRDLTADLLAAADLYVAPGPAETFGLSALEAMAAGIPVLSVDRGGVADRIRDSGAGALYPAGDSPALAEAAIRLFRGDLRTLGQTARATRKASLLAGRVRADLWVYRSVEIEGLRDVRIEDVLLSSTFSHDPYIPQSKHPHIPQSSVPLTAHLLCLGCVAADL